MIIYQNNNTYFYDHLSCKYKVIRRDKRGEEGRRGGGEEGSRREGGEEGRRGGGDE